MHDYGGHPFIFRLSEELARKGYNIDHFYSDASGGPITKPKQSSNNVDYHNIPGKKVKKMNFIYRWIQENIYSFKLIKKIKKINPDIVISATSPISAKRRLLKWSNKNSIPFIFWLQDVISVACRNLLPKKIGKLGRLISYYFKYIEKDLLDKSDHIILIANEFEEILKDWDLTDNNISIIPNWAPIEQLPEYSNKNEFSSEYNLNNKFVILYSGTLMMKHNPEIIIDAARKLSSNSEIMFVVISGERGRGILQNGKDEYNLSNLLLLPFQPFDILPKALASADILLTILEDSAGNFSVPSKVWTYYSAGRPNILSVPSDNLSAKITKRINAGVVVDCENYPDLASAIIDLKSKPELRKQMGKNARSYAENNFRIEEIADKFENIINKVI